MYQNEVATSSGGSSGYEPALWALRYLLLSGLGNATDSVLVRNDWERPCPDGAAQSAAGPGCWEPLCHGC